MKYRTLGKTGYTVSEVSLGTWQVGGGWGQAFDDKVAENIINAAIDEGVNFLDTADVYDDGKSEAAVARVVRQRNRGGKEDIRFATKCGRRIDPHTDENYTPKTLRLHVEESLRNTGLETLDLIQLHCPPTPVYSRPEIFGLFEDLQKEGKIRNLGVSVEKIEEAMTAVQYPNVSSVQIIFNMFRQKPAEAFFQEAQKKDVGIIVRVPLASGLLAGKYTARTSFHPQDHRSFNRDGATFDKGETFSGVDYDIALKAVEELKKALPQREDLAAVALRWILMFDQVSCIIPGASKPEQVQRNVRAVQAEPLAAQEMEVVAGIYNQYIRPSIHHLW
ncbi:Predicted oxidoreductase [Alkalispirochaeta americana]|uniref:Predicted oxidoreductase n=1 Tax=Alkalispirochaeta americana TaxID=159291 RepID=A0A1N6SLZ9_9SPIO|nr:aldo/keto reductase [Alkalispirochaeta americana]SIQ41966.1 Predicted oxidoreductase [Alkalispirochaeta americana]